MPHFNVEGLKLFYEIEGAGPPLFLINGLSNDTRGWKPLVDALKTSFQVVSYDMRCAGRSDKPDQPFSIGDLADEAHGLMGHLRLGKASVLGFSMGGMVAMSLACRYPIDVHQLFLVATAPSLKRPHPPSREVTEMLRRTDVSSALLTQVYESIFGRAYREAVSAEDFIRFRMNDTEAQPAFAYLRQMEALASCDLCDEVKGISIPSVVVAGTDDRLIPPANARWLKSHLIGSKLHLLEGIGHMVPLEAPAQLADVVKDGGRY